MRISKCPGCQPLSRKPTAAVIPSAIIAIVANHFTQTQTTLESHELTCPNKAREQRRSREQGIVCESLHLGNRMNARHGQGGEPAPDWITRPHKPIRGLCPSPQPAQSPFVNSTHDDLQAEQPEMGVTRVASRRKTTKAHTNTHTHAVCGTAGTQARLRLSRGTQGSCSSGNVRLICRRAEPRRQVHILLQEPLCLGLHVAQEARVDCGVAGEHAAGEHAARVQWAGQGGAGCACVRACAHACVRACVCVWVPCHQGGAAVGWLASWLTLGLLALPVRTRLLALCSTSRSPQIHNRAGKGVGGPKEAWSGGRTCTTNTKGA